MNKFVAIIFLIISGVNINTAQDIKFSATAVPRVLRVGEQFQLVYEINKNVSGLQIPELNDFQLLGGPSTGSSSSIQIVNGKTTSSVKYTYTYYLRAIKEGTFVIPAATAKFKKNTYQSNTVKIEVVKAKSTPSQTSPSDVTPTPKSSDGADIPADENLFIRLHVDKKNAYIGEQIIAWIKIYSKIDLTQIDPNFKGPDFTGFFQQPIDIPPLRSLERENVNGEIYGTGVLRKVVLYPQKAGEIIIQPFEIDVAYQKQVRRRSSSIFDDFFGPTVQNIPVKLKSKPLKLKIKALPANMPQSFTGAVGNFNLLASINKTQVKTNDAVTLKAIISGKGNIKLIDDLKINFPPALETFKPVTKTKQDNPLSGSQTFEYTLIPRYPGDFKIAPVEFSYFNPVSKSYKTLKSKEFNITVTKGKEDTATVIISGLSKEDIKLLGSDILFIKNRPFKLIARDNFLFGTTRFYTIYFVSFVLFVLLIILRRQRIKRNANIKLVKNRRANKYAHKRLKKASGFMKQNDSKGFYDEVLKAMWGYLSDKLNIPIADLSKSSSEEALVNVKINEKIMNKFYEIIDTCEYARYAPGEESSEMQKLYNDAMKIIIKLQQKLR
jgi:hypothetical protein